jgi:hypothetical protein
MCTVRPICTLILQSLALPAHVRRLVEAVQHTEQFLIARHAQEGAPLLH